MAPKAPTDEAVNIRRLVQQHGWNSLIVSELRAAPDPNYDASRWWQTEEGLVAVFNEVIKRAFYWARYGVAPVG